MLPGQPWSGYILVPTLRVGTASSTLCVVLRTDATQSVEEHVPTQSVGTRIRMLPGQPWSGYSE